MVRSDGRMNHRTPEEADRKADGHLQPETSMLTLTLILIRPYHQRNVIKFNRYLPSLEVRDMSFTIRQTS